jgi:hypothetical protein
LNAVDRLGTQEENATNATNTSAVRDGTNSSAVRRAPPDIVIRHHDDMPPVADEIELLPQETPLQTDVTVDITVAIDIERALARLYFDGVFIEAKQAAGGEFTEVFAPFRAWAGREPGRFGEPSGTSGESLLAWNGSAHHDLRIYHGREEAVCRRCCRVGTAAERHDRAVAYHNQTDVAVYENLAAEFGKIAAEERARRESVEVLDRRVPRALQTHKLLVLSENDLSAYDVQGLECKTLAQFLCPAPGSACFEQDLVVSETPLERKATRDILHQLEAWTGV